MPHRREALLTKLFGPDRRESDPTHIDAFISIQRLFRRLGSYSYLEVGSAEGASLEPYLIDPACQAAVSIDLRVFSQWDERGTLYYYPGATTAGMLAELAKCCTPDELSKLQAFDADSSVVASW